MASKVDRLPDLAASIQAAGFYPEASLAQVRLALGGEKVRAFVVLPEVSIDSDDGVEVSLHVVAMTKTRLISWGGYEDEISTSADDGDDGPPEEEEDAVPVLHSILHMYPLSKIDQVRVYHEIRNPERADPSGLPDGFRVMFLLPTLDGLMVEDGQCDDPNCSNAHGWTGSIVHNYLTFNESLAAVGDVKMAELVDFGMTALAAISKY